MSYWWSSDVHELQLTVIQYYLLSSTSWTSGLLSFSHQVSACLEEACFAPSAVCMTTSCFLQLKLFTSGVPCPLGTFTLYYRRLILWLNCVLYRTYSVKTVNHNYSLHRKPWLFWVDYLRVILLQGQLCSPLWDRKSSFCNVLEM